MNEIGTQNLKFIKWRLIKYSFFGKHDFLRN
jgi:hypothetical protein